MTPLASFALLAALVLAAIAFAVLIDELDKRR